MNRFSTICLFVSAIALGNQAIMAQSGTKTDSTDPLVPRLLTPASEKPLARVAMLDVADDESANPKAEPFEPGQTLAIVGGHPIFVSDMSMEIYQIFDQFMAGAPKSVKESQKPVLIRKLLPKYIDAKLLYVDVINELPAEANLEEIFESAGEQFDEKVLPFFKKKAGVVSAAELDAQLRIQGSSLRLMKKSWTENELVKYMTKQKIETQPELTRAELLAYYDGHKQDYAVEAKARWEQLVVRFDRFDSRTKARDSLAALGNKIYFGASFQATARNHSQGLRASGGGQQDWTAKGSLVSTELENAVFELPIDKLSDIIESKIGYHIIRVQERQEAGYIPFPEAQSDIREKITSQKREEDFQAHLVKLRETIPVDILLDE